MSSMKTPSAMSVIVPLFLVVILLAVLAAIGVRMDGKLVTRIAALEAHHAEEAK